MTKCLVIEARKKCQCESCKQRRHMAATNYYLLVQADLMAEIMAEIKKMKDK